MFKQIKKFLRPRFIRWGYGLDDTKETFWLWWLGMHPDHDIDDFWKNIQCDPWVPRIGPTPWDLYLSAREIHRKFFEFVETAQGSNVWGQERIERCFDELRTKQKKMIKPKRIQRKRTKGWRMPPNTVSVTRPGTWGNPHKVGGKITDFDAVAMCEDDLVNLRWKDRRGVPMLLRVHELRGKDVACFCREEACCHGDILLAYANCNWLDAPNFVWLSLDEDSKQIITEEELPSSLKYVLVPTDILAPKYLLAEQIDVLFLDLVPNPPKYIYIEKSMRGDWFIL